MLQNQIAKLKQELTTQKTELEKAQKDLSINSLSQREHQPDVTEIGTMVTEFDKLQKLYKQMIDDAARVEKEFYTICQKFHAEKTEWKNERIR